MICSGKLWRFARSADERIDSDFWRIGMNTLAAAIEQVGASSVRFEGAYLHLYLTDGRAIFLPFAQIPWLRWLTKASPEQRANWSIEPGGYAVYWADLDDGFEVAHALSLAPVR